jgi:hypothetical protein
MRNKLMSERLRTLSLEVTIQKKLSEIPSDEEIQVSFYFLAEPSIRNYWWKI